jgi:hypothetical protein
MVQKSIVVVIFLATLLAGCISSKIITAWKNETSSGFPYQKIMVAAIMKEDNDSLRIRVEEQVAAKLNKLGYYAVSTAGEYGRYGLETLGQEATYLSLCDNGVDAVLTIALVPDSIAADLKEGGAKKYTALYYYDHIWGYHKAGSIKGVARLKWEMILFDVSQLQPQFVLQSGPLPARQARAKVIELADQALQKLVKERMISNKDTLHRKPF